jgi:hypothetical protein
MLLGGAILIPACLELPFKIFESWPEKVSKVYLGSGFGFQVGLDLAKYSFCASYRVLGFF